MLAVGVIFLCWLGVLKSLYRGAQICQLLFWVFLGCWLGVASLYQLANRRAAWGDSAVLLDRSSVITAQWLVLLSLLAFFAGSSVYPTLARFRSGASTLYRTPLDEGRLTRALTVGTIMAVSLIPVAALYSGGLRGLFATRQERGTSLAAQGVTVANGAGSTVGLVSILPAAVAAVVAYYGAVLWRERDRRVRFSDRRATTPVLCASGVALLIILANPFANTRFISAAAIVGAIFAFTRPTARRAGAAVAALGVFGTLLAYPLAYSLRFESSTGNSGFDLSDWAGPDFDGFQQVVNSISYVSSHGYTSGRQIASAVLFFIPRTSWTSKPYPLSIDIAQSRGYAFTNLSLPLPAELVVDVGWVGMAIAMFVIGYMWCMLDGVWLDSSRRLSSLVAPVVATQQLGLLRGPLGSLMPVAETTVALAVIVGWLSTGGFDEENDVGRNIRFELERSR